MITMRYRKDGVQCDRVYCKADRHQQQKLLTLMSSYQQLNAAEKCGDIYEVATSHIVGICI